MRLQEYLKDNYGYDSTVNDSWSPYVETWISWYKGKVKKFHNYNIYNGRSTIQMERLSMQMAKKCCEDWADLLFNERCKISLKDENSLKQLNDILSQNDFWHLINESIERSGASGTGAIVTSVSDIEFNEDRNTIDVTSSKVNLEYINIDQIYPISWQGRKITECAFAGHKTVKGKNYIYLSVHRKNEYGNYVIDNRLFLDNKGALTEENIENQAFREFDTKSPIPWFAILHPVGANNINPTLPWGIPYFANAIDTLKSIDIGFDSFVNEIILGRKRLFLREEMLTYDNNGEHKVFDDRDISVYCLPSGINKDDMFQSDNTDIRSEALTSYIKTMLSIFSSLIGLGENHYNFDPVSLTTATQVISQNSEMYRRKKKEESTLESALFDIIQSVSYASSAFGTNNIDTNGLVIQFDDSIIEDTEALANRAMRELSAGVLSPVEYRERIFGETKEIAASKIKEIKENYPTMSDLIGSASENA